MNKFNLLDHGSSPDLQPPIANSQSSSEFSKTSDFYFSDFTGSESDTERLEEEELQRAKFRAEINDATSAMLHLRDDSDDYSSSELEVVEETQEDEVNDANQSHLSVGLDIHFLTIDCN